MLNSLVSHAFLTRSAALATTPAAGVAVGSAPAAGSRPGSRGCDVSDRGDSTATSAILASYLVRIILQISKAHSIVANCFCETSDKNPRA